MTQHKYGGGWTADKLNRLGKYLSAYTTIFTRNERARFLRTTYVDAFAGTGAYTPQQTSQASPNMFDPDADVAIDEFRSGSARIALQIEPSFDRYIFIEQQPERVSDLRRLASEYQRKIVKVVEGDANSELVEFCTKTEWRQNRAVGFLDPYGAQVDWSTIAIIASTRSIDLWWLFPVGAVLRMLPHSARPPPAWAAKLDRILGTPAWLDEFYKVNRVETLFGQDDQNRRDATVETVRRFLVCRLTSEFAGVAQQPLVLRNSRGAPLFFLCFAAGHPKGAKIAIRIADHLLKEP